jgi:hypothetical protein
MATQDRARPFSDYRQEHCRRNIARVASLPPTAWQM